MAFLKTSILLEKKKEGKKTHEVLLVVHLVRPSSRMHFLAVLFVVYLVGPSSRMRFLAVLFVEDLESSSQMSVESCFSPMIVVQKCL